jgi:hypothetical protein
MLLKQSAGSIAPRGYGLTEATSTTPGKITFDAERFLQWLPKHVRFGGSAF